MAWIKEIDVEQAEGKLKEVYKRILKRTDKVANILKVHSLNPEVLEAHLDLYERVMFGESNLSRGEREMIAVVVSSANACDYWETHHGESLRIASEESIMDQVKKNYKTADISKAEKLMLYYAEKLTKKSYTIQKSDIEKLRNVGFSDRDIFDMNQVCAYFNYVNRIADGLGVVLEE